MKPVLTPGLLCAGKNGGSSVREVPKPISDVGMYGIPGEFVRDSFERS
jgi:hypothetical protein